MCEGIGKIYRLHVEGMKIQRYWTLRLKDSRRNFNNWDLKFILSISIPPRTESIKFNLSDIMQPNIIKLFFNLLDLKNHPLCKLNFINWALVNSCFPPSPWGYFIFWVYTQLSVKAKYKAWQRKFATLLEYQKVYNEKLTYT